MFPDRSVESLLLSNGTLINGTGASAISRNLLIRGQRIAEIRTFPAPKEAYVVDCTGLAIAPGFIDGHGHSDLQVLAVGTDGDFKLGIALVTIHVSRI